VVIFPILDGFNHSNNFNLLLFRFSFLDTDAPNILYDLFGIELPDIPIEDSLYGLVACYAIVYPTYFRKFPLPTINGTEGVKKLLYLVQMLVLPLGLFV
jgi:hypothetical protein